VALRDGMVTEVLGGGAVDDGDIAVGVDPGLARERPGRRDPLVEILSRVDAEQGQVGEALKSQAICQKCAYACKSQPSADCLCGAEIAFIPATQLVRLSCRPYACAYIISFHCL
jgi:hypothetical protein